MLIRYTWLLLLFVSSQSFAATPPGAAIATAHPLATRAGFEILDAGGNAFDAAVAISATLAVVEPYGSGLGGGGFWLLHRASDKKNVMIDGREKAPLAAHRDMYLDKKGEVIPNLSVDGALAAGIPGEPAALAHLAKHYGRLPLSVTLAPAIRAAKQGFSVTPYYQRMARFRLEALRASPAASAVFLKNNEVPADGDLIKQPDLARTLALIAKQGHAGFYQGRLAKKLVSENQQAGGIWSEKDLQQYQVVERQPVVGRYRGYRIVSAAPPSSGGVALISMLNMLSGFDLEAMNKVTRTHVLVEIMRRAYRDRAEYLGDADFVDVPVKQLLSPVYAKKLREDIDIEKATPSSSLKKAFNQGSGFHTSHFSVIDKQGNRVAATLSVNFPFGSAYMVPGTGVLLNDEMDDFSSRPGTPNVYGLIGAEANAIAPGKRMLSSMSPTFIESEDRIAVLGTPGGSRIISMVLHGVLGVVDNKDAYSIVSQPRFHHQYLPDTLQHESKTFDDALAAELQFMGHVPRLIENGFGNMQMVIWNRRDNKLEAASDPRGEGLAIAR